MNASLLALLCSLMIASGQVLWKIALGKNGGLIKPGVPFINNIINLLSSPYMLAGITIYGFATIFWMYLLGKYDYSYIYPMLAITYIFSFLFALYLFKENVNIYRWIGMIFIIIGVIFVNRGS